MFEGWEENTSRAAAECNSPAAAPGKIYTRLVFDNGNSRILFPVAA